MQIKLSPDTANKGSCSQHSVLSFQASYKPLLKQVVEEIFNPEKPDPTDIEHTSSGLTDLLKTGFSMFMKVSNHEGDVLSVTMSPLLSMGMLAHSARETMVFYNHGNPH